MNYSNIHQKYSYGGGHGGYAPYNTNFTLEKVGQTPRFEKYQDDIYRTGNKPRKFETNRNVAVKGLFCEEDVDELSKMFFSDENTKRIQRLIRKEVFRRTKGEFRLDTDQDESDILVAMRAVFFEEGRFLPNKIIRQVKHLNQRVIDLYVPDIITQIKQDYGYIKEINKPLEPIMRPINVNNAGRRALPSLTTTWGF